ncbi:MAG TPA: molybdopterin-dependent oxidoreductase [Hyphomicrobiaceae bacterium]|nr:molybdopterin-dependent oxidoreductase [Hyphomicrobiaceae bacterium]
MGRTERSIEELYAHDPERADAILFGRRTDLSRRGFVGGAGIAAMSVAVGGPIVFAASMPGGLIPAALAQDTRNESAAETATAPRKLDFPGKDGGLIVLGDKPLVAETPEQLLDDDTTPTAKFFIRNNGRIPEAAAEPDAWKLTIDGEVSKPFEITLGELKRRSQPRTYRMVLECAGNGRSFFTPQADGDQWTNGGAGCAEWTGVPLGDLLRAVGLRATAVHTANTGTDMHLSGDPRREPLSRGVPIRKAMEPHSLLVWGMNGRPLENIHGGPLRLIHPGWPGSASHKWLSKITIRDKVHDGQGMLGTSYRVAIKPMVPGSKADDANFKILESMPVRSILTSPANGTRYPAGTKELKLRGAAWAGDVDVQRVEVSIDFGATWLRTVLAPLKNRYDWRRWTASVPLPSEGYYEIWVRATDANGKSQPHIAGNWNPQGYGANPMHRIAVLVG